MGADPPRLCAGCQSLELQWGFVSGGCTLQEHLLQFEHLILSGLGMIYKRLPALD